MVEALPRQFGSYVLERRLGVGGMAETFVARRAAYDGVEQRVCLKRVLPAFNQDPTFVRQFQREAKLAGRLRHSHVVGVLDFGEHQGEQYMALELVDGVDLRALLASSEDGRLPPALAALIALDLAYALEYAHEQGVVHRDVTPSNVLLSQRGEVKLADFGVAKALTGATIATASGFVKGKVPYMAPEQMRGTDVDGRADVFSLGVTLFEMLAGRRPFVGQHDVEVMMKILEGERATLREVAPDVPEALAAAVEGCLHTDREQRWDDAGALIDALTPTLGSPKARDTLAERVRQAHAVPAEPLGTRDTELAEVPEAARAAADVPATMASAPATDARGRLPTPGAALDSQQPAPRLTEETPARPASSRRGLVVAAALLLLGGGGAA
ncbi:MAG TPA: serine/threonine-protein kinase, partial [Polyangiaceae bacterium LLY-WYZ-15_(1-7)]|nr:serine/threonine-protein kinase [Polyangiaceae bacterium LLY-WYZ-15_(1-7)]